MGRRPKKFRPFKNPRYLVGSVPKHELLKDLEEYNKHRYKVFTVETKVDDKPPKMNPYNYINHRKLSTDMERMFAIDKENKDLLKKINIINRTTGRVDSYNPNAYFRKSKWKTHETEMRRIQKHNKEIYKSIKQAKSLYEKQKMDQFWKEIVEKLRDACAFPLVVLKKSNLDKTIAAQPSLSCGLDETSKLIDQRPWCFMDFAVRNDKKLGRILIELYHDFVPVTVQNFLTIIKGDTPKLTYKDNVIHRIVKGQYCELGDITKGTGRGGMSIYGEYFAEENHVLKHTKAGVLSMVRVNNQENNSIFCITFDQVEKLDHQNVVFGRIIKGVDVILKFNGYARKIGKPLDEIYISNCGVVERK